MKNGGDGGDKKKRGKTVGAILEENIKWASGPQNLFAVPSFCR